MKILFLHNFGPELGDWNNRIKRQIELMDDKCYLKVYAPRLGASQSDLLKETKLQIDKECFLEHPNIIYAVGPIMGDLVSDKNNVVYDAGTFKSLNILIENQRLNHLDIDKKIGKELRDILSRDSQNYLYEMESKAIRNAKAVIVWDNKEADLIEKIFEVNTVKRISMNFSKLVPQIPFEQKKNRILMVASKWDRINKNGKLVYKLMQYLDANKEIDYEVLQIGRGAKLKDNSFLRHDELILKMNESKVLFAPYLCGGCGTIMEGIGLGCNVVIGDWHQFSNLINDNLLIKDISDKHYIEKCMSVIDRAMKEYFPPKKVIKEECIQLNKIMSICEQYDNLREI